MNSASLASPTYRQLMEFNPFVRAALYFMLLLLPSPSSAVPHSNLTDLAALLAFKARVRDPYSILSTNWTPNASFCTWMGVSCSRRRQRVVALHFNNFPLHGTISPHLANLSFLSVLYLSNNSLVGPVPDSLAQLPRLKILVLQLNQLSGSIPPAIFNMSLLTALSLSANNLSGTLPSNRSLVPTVLPRVQLLMLSKNQLSGNIPAGLCHCHDLRNLSLSYNKFSGNIPMELGNLKQLTNLYLGQNNLTGTLPASLGNLTNLLQLDLVSNSFRGSIPEELGGLSHLQYLNLGNNHAITDSIPISLSNLSSLSLLGLDKCMLSGSIRVNFRNMLHLQRLYLGSNMLTGGLEFLESLSHSKVLKIIALEGNELDDFLPNTIGNLSTNLYVFSAHHNRIKGKLPAELGNLSSLGYLELGVNELDGTIPLQITMMENLQIIDFSYNMMNGSIPHEHGQLRLLNILFLTGNRFSGSIPDSLGNISSLSQLLLGANSLSFKIPQNLWSLTGLIRLDLLQNFLSGFLSSEVGNIKNLAILDISNNQLSGEIPSSMKELQMLEYLDFAYNSFNGQIPPSFGELISVQVLNLSNNNLSGVIPVSLANLRYLSSINLSFNKLKGKIPSSGVFSNISLMSLVGNTALCGAPKLGFPPCSVTAISTSKSTVHLLWYILPTVASAVIIVIACWILFRKQTKNVAPAHTQSPDNYRLISYHELACATDNFSEANLLGRGRFGSVYKGCLDDGLLIAVKVLNLEVEGASRSFDAECSALRMVRHRNLVKIITTCSNLDFKALVLQFMPNGSLEMWLYSPNYCLSLLQRINIIVDVASALEYLHHNHSPIVLHCDLKPSNVLLDEEMTAHLSDFGIAKMLGSDSRSATSTSTPGTIGYISPEYAATGRVSRKGDVYSFGILLLELFTRKKPTDPMFVGESSLRRWICDAHPDALLEIVDSNLLKDGSGSEISSEDQISLRACLSSIVELGIICSKDSPKERLAMKEVVPKLRSDYLLPVV